MIKNCLNISKDILKFEFIFRFIYICTYMNKDGYLEFESPSDNKRFIKKKDLFEMLNLKKTETYNTIRYFYNNNMIQLDDKGNIKINMHFVSNKRLKNKSCILSKSAIRYIYENAIPRKHAFLNEFFKFIINSNKYINIKNTYKSKWFIIPMKLKDITYSIGYKNSNRVMKDLKNLKISKDDFLIKVVDIESKKVMLLNTNLFKPK